jgi:catechol 2,3-dioxygenase-like lactoylglutathione lyase family enzyme
MKRGMKMINIKSIDHIVLTVKDIEKTLAFYHDVLGMKIETFADNRKGLSFGIQKLNLHMSGHEFTPAASKPTPGSIDLCLITETPLEEVIKILNKHKIKIEVGPVEKVGARGPILSVYFRDPDLNLLEVSNYPIDRK